MNKFLMTTMFLFIFVAFVSAQEIKTRSLFPINKDGKCGYINKTGKIIIRPRFKLCGIFSEGLASVMLVNENRGFVDETGRFVIEPKLGKWFGGNFSEGYAAVALENDERGYVDKSGNFTLLENCSYVGSFSEGLAVIERNDLKGYIDKKFNVVVEPKFQHAGNFADGFAPVRDLNDSYYYIDKTGQMAINFDGGEFSEGFAFIEVEGKYGFIDITGKVVISPQFDGARFFYEGLAPIMVKDKWGFVDKSGQIVIEPRFDDVDKFFPDGLAPVNMGDKGGFINRKGELVIGLPFDNTEWFYGGLGRVTVKDKWGYVDSFGKVIWQPTK